MNDPAPAEPAPPAEPRPLIAEVIAIGDELTTGQRLDTNTQWLAERLTEGGCVVRYHTTVADVLDANVRVFRTAAERADVVVCTGGLGPTADDLTRDSLAMAAGVALTERAELAEQIEQRFRSRGRTMPPQNLRQAQLPEGAVAIPNPGGTAPGVDFTLGVTAKRPAGCRVFALPGVPAEMRVMWDATVARAIAGMGGPRRVTRHWIVRCFGAGESHTESLIPELIARGREPLVGITASKGTITLRVTASGEDETACWRAMRPTLEEIRREVSDFIFAEFPASAGGETTLDRQMQHALLEELEQRELGVSVTESMTLGLVTQLLAEGEAELAAEIAYEGQWVHLGRFAPGTGADVAQAAREIAGRGCAIVVGDERDGVVPVAAAWPCPEGPGADGPGVATLDVTLVGDPSIHRPLVAKHAMNLLRKRLLESFPNVRGDE